LHGELAAIHKEMTMLKRLTIFAFLIGSLAAQYGCGYVAAGAAGAAIGHEAAERNNDDD
jgi:hypothetical protein